MIYEDINILSKIYICINICLVVFQIVRSVPPLNNVIKLCEAIETIISVQCLCKTCVDWSIVVFN